MKKKIKLSELKVNSFVTELNQEKGKSVKGGGSVAVQDDTFYSCYAYVSCDVIDCAGTGHYCENVSATSCIAIDS